MRLRRVPCRSATPRTDCPHALERTPLRRALIRASNADDTTGRTIVLGRHDVARDRVEGTRPGPCAVPLDAYLSRVVQVTAFTGV